MEVETLNLIEAAAFLKMTADSLRKKAKKGIIPGAKPGRDWLFIKSDLVEYIRLGYHSNVRQPLLVNEREARWQHKNFISAIEARSGSTDLQTHTASKFAEVRARLTKERHKKS